MRAAIGAFVVGVVACAWPGLTVAQDGAAVSPSTSDSFMQRHRPTAMSYEAGLYLGAHWFSAEHNLQDTDRPGTGGHQQLSTGGEMGLRVAFFPLAFVGAEMETGVTFSGTETTDKSAKVLVFRGHLIAQLPAARIVPFVLIGGGVVSLRSGDDALGTDSDPAVHFGAGVKFAVTKLISARLDLRDSLIQRNRLLPDSQDGDLVHNVELLVGASVTIGRTPWAPVIAPSDRDRDGIYNRDDQCPSEPGPGPTGCPPPPPPPPPDADADGNPDTTDPCPAEPEDGNSPDAHDGCPNKDLDADNILLPADLCPERAGIAPDGCPPRDTDGDGLMDADDRCVSDPETRNSFEDADGCPDELPAAVKKFTGVIRGIQFDTGKARIRPSSFPLLDDAVRLLQEYTDLRIRISGHTDNKGDHDANVQLSLERANAVKTYLESKGIAATRVETRGVGPDQPVADNANEVGRGQNRRIEFELIPQ